jgi:molecular chaperone DnaK (HSP70)
MESITITNEKGRLSQEDIDRMVKEAEQFATEDELHRKRIESLNGLSSFVFGFKNQLGDQEGLGGKINDEDKKTILAATKETADWIEENGQIASVEELEEKLTGTYSGSHTFFDQTFTKLQRFKALLLPSLRSSTQTPLGRIVKKFPIMMNCDA